MWVEPCLVAWQYSAALTVAASPAAELPQAAVAPTAPLASPAELSAGLAASELAARSR